MLRAFFNRLLGRSKSGPTPGAELDLPHVSEIPKVGWPPPSSLPPPPPTRGEIESWIRRHIERDVTAGYLSREEIIQSVCDVFMDEMPEDEIAVFAGGMIDDVIARHRAEQASWPEITDCDRLDAAFRTLEEKGIVARQHFSCCGTCGSAEIWDEMDAADRAGLPSRGYAFFHMQDTESAVEGRGLYLNYGAKEEGESAAVGIGHEIQQELERHGLTTNWDGQHARRIGLSLDWKRRSQPA